MGVRGRALAVVLTLALLWTGCARVGGGGGGGGSGSSGPPPSVAGAWNGYLSVDGQLIQGRLTLSQDQGRLRAVFEAPSLDLRAEGEGRIEGGGALRITLVYEGACPGTTELEGRRSSDGLVLDGSLSAADCTGRSRGAFSFRR